MLEVWRLVARLRFSLVHCRLSLSQVGNVLPVAVRYSNGACECGVVVLEVLSSEVLDVLAIESSGCLENVVSFVLDKRLRFNGVLVVAGLIELLVEVLDLV